MRKALITGVTGQDGAYLAEFLLGKGYEVLGIKRRSYSLNTGRVDHLYGLKENVIVGRLIPAGTGMEFYRRITIAPDEPPVVEEEPEIPEEVAAALPPAADEGLLSMQEDKGAV